MPATPSSSRKPPRRRDPLVDAPVATAAVVVAVAVLAVAVVAVVVVVVAEAATERQQPTQITIEEAMVYPAETGSQSQRQLIRAARLHLADRCSL
mmetsp:Transcript_55644/g.76527  ORF Transcript_55644/g.76527 Transcript_55644/m.76527 type:complete len:95 (-) Transcript_55644:51-335(-)